MKIAYQRIVFLLLAAPLVLVQAGCRKLVDVAAPVTSTNGANVYNTDANAAAVLTGVYTTISKASLLGGGLTSMSLFPGLSADELTLYGGTTNTSALLVAHYTNGLNNSIAGGADFSANIYPLLFTANAAIEGLTAAKSLTPAVKQQLLGEAKFVRGFCYFYLVNLYGDIPMPLNTDYTKNADLAATPQAQVYQQIVADLKDAEDMLSSSYLQADALNPYPAGSEERTRPTKWAAAALLARVYLYTGDWADAEAQASIVIGNTSYYSLVPTASVFLKNNKEAIWQLQPVTSGYNTADARLFVLPSAGPTANATYPVYLSSNVMSAFDSGDLRKTSWTGSVTVTTGGVARTYYYPAKYRSNLFNAPLTEYTDVLRLGEQYLIRAEARVEGGNPAGGIADLNTIRSRAGLPAWSGATDNGSVLAAIMHERQVELFAEWGHRWLDLKRTKTVDAVMGGPSGGCAAKGGTWNSNWQWYPFRLTDLQKDPNMTQNAGY